MVTEKDYKGATETLNINGAINNLVTAFSVKTTPSSNWPTGSSLPFVITVDRGTATEETMLCSARSTSNFTVTTRGYAGTTAVGHSDNATVEHTVDAIALSDMIHAAANTTGLITTAEDLLVGTGLGTMKRLGKGSNGQLLQVLAGALAYGGLPAGAVTAGVIAAGGVSASNQFAAGVVDTTAILDATILVGDIAASAKDAAAGTASLRSLSNTATTACAGNDSRLSDTRTPSAGSITQAMMSTGLRAHNVTSSIAPSSPVAGDLWYTQTNNTLNVYNGTDWVCLTPQSASVATSEALGSTGAYVNLTTVGPSVSIQTGTKALVTLSCAFNSTQAPTVNVGFTVSGATTLAASDANSIGPKNIDALHNETGARTFLLTGLTGGVNTFVMRYKGTATGITNFLNRDITVVGIPG